MNQTNVPVGPTAVVRISQIVAGALITGVVIFAGIAFFIANGAPPPTPLISLIAVAFAGVIAVMRFVVPRLMVGATKNQLRGMPEPELLLRLAGLYQSKTIVGLALLEGAAFFNLVAYTIEKQLWTYGIVAFLLTLMAMSFPSEGQFESWAEDVKREIQ
jgi:hypothetical protein